MYSNCAACGRWMKKRGTRKRRRDGLEGGGRVEQVTNGDDSWVAEEFISLVEFLDCRCHSTA